MQKPSSISTGVKGTAVSAATVATTKYSVATAFENKYGDRYVAVTVKSNVVYSIYCLGSDTQWSSTADAGAGTTYGKLLGSETGQLATGTATTGGEGKTFYFPCATMRYVLPVLYQATGGNATVTIKYQTFND